MTGIFLFMLAVFILYIGSIVYFYGVQSSISESFYRLPLKWQFAFSFFCWGISIPAMILATSVYMFVAGTAIALVGAANTFKKEFVWNMHMAGAITSVVASQAYILFDQHLYYLNITFLIFATFIVLITDLFKKDMKYFWWIEIAAFVCIFYTLYLKLFTI